MVVFSFISWKHAGMNNIDSIGYDDDEEKTVWQKFSLRDGWGWLVGLVGLATSFNTMVTYERGNYMHCCPVIISYI